MLISFLYMRVCRYECVPLLTQFCILNLRDKNNKSSSRSKKLNLRWKRIMQKNMEMCRRHDKTIWHQRKLISISRGKRVQYWSSLWHYILTRTITSNIFIWKLYSLICVYLYSKHIKHMNDAVPFLRSRFCITHLIWLNFFESILCAESRSTFRKVKNIHYFM